MAHVYDPNRFDTPERSIRFIRADRQRRSITAVVVGAVAAIVTLGAFYLSYRDVPAPPTPANANSQILEPYR